MENKEIILVSVIAVLLVGAVLVISLSGDGDVTGQAGRACTDSDGGMNYFVEGTVRSGSRALRDRCISRSGKLVETYCSSMGAMQSSEVSCPNGYSCTSGACVIIGGGSVFYMNIGDSAAVGGHTIRLEDVADGVVGVSVDGGAIETIEYNNSHSWLDLGIQVYLLDVFYRRENPSSSTASLRIDVISGGGSSNATNGSGGGGSTAPTCPSLNMQFRTVDLRDAGGNYGGSTSENVLKISTVTGERIQLDRGELGWLSQSDALSDQLTPEIYLRTNSSHTEVFFIAALNDVAYAGTIGSNASFGYVSNKTNCKIWKNVWSMN